MRTLKSIVALVAVAVAVIVGPMGTDQRAGSKPRNQERPLLSNPEATQALVRACGNCHSNHTEWPWYGHVPPVSWWIERHVREGKEKLDFSEWETYSTWRKRNTLESMCGLISTGRMPAAVHCNAPRGKTLREGQESSVRSDQEQSLSFACVGFLRVLHSFLSMRNFIVQQQIRLFSWQVEC